MALETRNSGGNTTYLQLDFNKKSFFIYSKEPQEGYAEHEAKNGNKSYRKHINAVTGTIKGGYFRDGNFGKEFVLQLEDNGERYAIQMGVEDSIFSSLARYVENIDVSKVVKLSVYDNKGYFNLSVSYPEDLNDEGKAKLVEWGAELPKWDQLRSGKWDKTKFNDEAYGRVEDFVNNSGFEKYEPNKSNTESTSESSKSASVKEKPKDKVVDNGNDDSDLPF